MVEIGRGVVVCGRGRKTNERLLWHSVPRNDKIRKQCVTNHMDEYTALTPKSSDVRLSLPLQVMQCSLLE